MNKLPWYRQTPEETSQEFASDLQRGLKASEAVRRLAEDGPNELVRKEGPSILSMFLGQFKDFLVLILIAAGFVSMLVGEVTDSIVIIGIVIVNAALGVFQEFRANKAMEALKKMAAPNAKVIRDGNHLTIPARELVKGDLVILETGDYIPADLRLTETMNLKIEEAALTGESVPVEKYADITFKEEIGLGDQVNQGFMSTLVTYGRGKGIVTATGMDTIIGKIAEMIQDVEEEDTPLQKKLTQFGKYLGVACLAVCAIVFVMGIMRGEELITMFMTAVSLAVAAIPEGLPAVVTIVLALGMQRMVQRNSIAKKLHAVETLGSTTVICSDKTGTLTQNQMTAVKVYTAGTLYDISGEGYCPRGECTIDGKTHQAHEDQSLIRLLKISCLCNDSRLESEETAEGEKWRILGDPTEGALVVAAAKFGLERDELNSSDPRVQEIPFDSKRKLMTTFHRLKDGQYAAYTKGAPDVLVDKCTKIQRKDGIIDNITNEDKADILKQNQALAGQALRVLALAYKMVEKVPEHPDPDNDEKDLIFSGLIGMIDLPRAEAVEAIKICKTAGIRVVMITGDYKDTAAAIARELGIIDKQGSVLTGPELNQLNDTELSQAVRRTNVFARVSPEHKVKIVQAIKENGGIVAMTGDGINDAPALKRADIGIAMGITGTDVTKETADMVITDDNFATIVSAVEEGRVIYSNIRKFVFFLLSCNIAEILIIFLAMLLGWPIPLLPIHLLWVNLVTDAFPALALGMEKKEPNIMEEPPRNPDEPIINRDMGINIAVQSSILTLTVLGAFYFALTQYNNLELARTYAFVTLITAELFRSYSARSEKFTLRRIGFFTNRSMNVALLVSYGLLLLVMLVPSLQDVFKTAPLHMKDWDLIIIFSLMPLIFGELTKIVKYHHGIRTR